MWPSETGGMVSSKGKSKNKDKRFAVGWYGVSVPGRDGRKGPCRLSLGGADGSSAAAGVPCGGSSFALLVLFKKQQQAGDLR